MKRFIACLMFLLTIITLSAQNVIDTTLGTGNNNVARYKLYPTNNMWIFLKLDTSNGRLWLVQWSLDDDKRFETFLSIFPQVGKDEEVTGRFVLYPTQNNYNFIMLDQVSGKAYQVQWSIDYENRFVLPIE